MSYLAINEWGWVGYEEWNRSRRVLSTEANTLRDLLNSSYPTKADSVRLGLSSSANILQVVSVAIQQ